MASVRVLPAACALLLVTLSARGQAPGRAGVSFSTEIVSPATMRKTSDSMLFDPGFTGPTLLSWKAARDLKLGTASREVFHPSHMAQLTQKRRSVPLDRYPGLATMPPVGPPAYLKGGARIRPYIEVYTFRPEKGFHVAGTDSRGKTRMAHLREICVPANSRIVSASQSIAGPDFVGRFDAAIAGTGPSATVLWDQHGPKRGAGRAPTRLHKKLNLPF